MICVNIVGGNAVPPLAKKGITEEFTSLPSQISKSSGSVFHDENAAMSMMKFVLTKNERKLKS